ncbi:hypothetical protein VTH06DRAFT_5863 [Thermothelomyces fergusii]
MGRTKRNWTAHEDALLRAAVNDALANSRPLLWRDLAKAVPGRTNKDCRRRWWNALAEGIAKGPWSEKEDERLIEAVHKYGTQWSLVAQAVSSRNSEQCSSHWAQVLDPSINYCDWSRGEDEALLHAVLTHGTNWTKIAATHVPKRTTLALKNRYSGLRLRHRNQSGRRHSATGATYLAQNGRDTSSSDGSPGRQNIRGRKRAYSSEDGDGYERNSHVHDEDDDDEDDDEDDEDEEQRKGNSGAGNTMGAGDSMSLGLLHRDKRRHSQAMPRGTSNEMQGMESEPRASGGAMGAPPTGVSDSDDAWAAFQGTQDEHMGRPCESNDSYKPSAASLMGSRMSDLPDFSTYPSLTEMHHYGGGGFPPPDERPDELKVGPPFADTAQLSGFLFPPLPVHQSDAPIEPVALAEFDHSLKQTAGTEGFRWSPIGTKPPGLPSPQIGAAGQHPRAARKSATSESNTSTTSRQPQPQQQQQQSPPPPPSSSSSQPPQPSQPQPSPPPPPQQQQQQQQQQQPQPQPQGHRDDGFSGYGTMPVSPASTGGSGACIDMAPSPLRPALYRVSVQVTCDQEQLVCLMSRITNVGTQLSVQVDPQRV